MKSEKLKSIISGLEKTEILIGSQLKLKLLQPPLGDIRDEMLPFIILISLRVELLLKVLLLQEANRQNLIKKEKNHELEKLFSLLSDEIKSIIQTEVCKELQFCIKEFHESLALNNLSFVEWRYLDTEEEPKFSLEFMMAFAKSLTNKII